MQNQIAAKQTKILIEAASAGLMGLAMKALLKDGRDEADACLARVADGRAFIETTVIFSSRGVSAVGHYCSHGSRAHLFTVNAVEDLKPSH